MSDRPSYEYLLIVRRDSEERLAYLQAAFADRPNVRVMADRRNGDRRGQQHTDVPVDRRRRDRRASMPPSWDIADYVLVPLREPS